MDGWSFNMNLIDKALKDFMFRKIYSPCYLIAVEGN